MSAGHVIAFRFNQAIAQTGTATIVDAMGMPVGNVAGVSAQGSDVLVTLAGVPDRQRVTVTLSGVNGVVGNYPVSIGFLIGDVTGTGAVNAGDISAVKARVNVAVGLSTFRFDLNANGAITPQDVSMVKARAGVVLP